jgi:hypothetical protein
MYKLIAVLALSLTGAAAAQAMAHPPSSWWQSHDHNWQHRDQGDRGYTPPHSMAAPEIDPASAVGGLTLLLGGLAVIRGRRGKR